MHGGARALAGCMLLPLELAYRALRTLGTGALLELVARSDGARVVTQMCFADGVLGVPRHPRPPASCTSSPRCPPRSPSCAGCVVRTCSKTSPRNSRRAGASADGRRRRVPRRAARDARRVEVRVRAQRRRDLTLMYLLSAVACTVEVDSMIT